MKKLMNIFESHQLLRIGTLDATGFPNVRSVDYAANPDKPSVLYFTTFKNTNKVKEIANDNRVYVVVDKAADSIGELSQIKYFRGKGFAYEVAEPTEAQNAMGLLIKRYPFLTELPGDPADMSIYRIELTEGKITDNSLGFGSAEEVSFS